MRVNVIHVATIAIAIAMQLHRPLKL